VGSIAGKRAKLQIGTVMEEIKIPQLGQSVEEAAIVEWFKREGDSVKQGEPLFSIQTDKAEIECESTADGVLRKILVEPDVFVPVLSVVALVGDAQESLPDLAAYETAEGGPVEQAAGEQPTVEDARETAAGAESRAPGEEGGRKAVSPRARKKAGTLGVDPGVVAGSGPGGRVIEADVVAYAESRPSVRATPTARRLAEAKGVDVTAVAGTGVGGKVTKEDVLRGEARPAPAAPEQPPSGRPLLAPGEARRVPLTPMRRIIAQRMAESKFSAPHYYMTIEVDMAAAKAFRAGVPFKVSFNDLIVRATALAIGMHPQVNARWAGDAVEEVGDINLGIAVALPSGLIVPVVKQAQTKSLQAISSESKDLAEKARSGKLTPADYAGSTFTISNLGAFGIDHFTAIINQPNSAILAVGQIKDRAVVIDGGIHIRPIMKLTLSSDHRVIDGAVAAQFMSSLKEILEKADF
jgi:pyruvate dehydrogenase E2 component (dihydrolipoamide acetyltransferase)